MKLKKQLQPKGFSLPEVAIAVAIAALGLVAILGLLPQGLEMSRKTGMLTAQRSIVEQVIRDLEQTDWTKLVQEKKLRHYDDQGVETLASSPSVTYVANVEVQDLTAKLPADTEAQKYFRKVVVKIATSRNDAFDFAETNNKSYNTFYHYIAKGR